MNRYADILKKASEVKSNTEQEYMAMYLQDITAYGFQEHGVDFNERQSMIDYINRLDPDKLRHLCLVMLAEQHHDWAVKAHHEEEHEGGLI